MLKSVSPNPRGEAAISAKNGSIKLVAGNSNPELAAAISAWLDVPLTKASVRRFADNEIFVEVLENVRGSDVFVIQSTSYPANDHLMELLIITDALRRASARRITAVIPYFGYARQDRKAGSRSPISAKLVANGKEAVAAATLHPYDLIFMDCEMPEMDGFAAAREIRRLEAQERHTAIIAMTAHTSESDAEKCLAAGMDGHLSKPITVEKIAFALARHTAVDASTLIQLRGQGPEGVEFMNDVIAQYLLDAPAYILAAREGATTNNHEKVRQAAHGLKGSSSNFNAGHLCALSAQLEREAGEGLLTHAHALVTALQDEFQNVRAALETAQRNVTECHGGIDGK